MIPVSNNKSLNDHDCNGSQRLNCNVTDTATVTSYQAAAHHLIELIRQQYISIFPTFECNTKSKSSNPKLDNKRNSIRHDMSKYD